MSTEETDQEMAQAGNGTQVREESAPARKASSSAGGEGGAFQSG